MIRYLLPELCAVVESRAGPPTPLNLLGEEEELVAAATPARREEFAAGRACARAALVQLGVPTGPIGRAGRGAPRWPDRVVGSITHCAGYRAAAVARRDDLLALGIDAEPNERLPDGVLPLVSNPPERVHLDALLRSHPEIAWDRLLFSAKESVYKCWYPIMGTWLDFTGANITFDPASGRFGAQLLSRPLLLAGRPAAQLDGRWVVIDGLILTALALSATARPADPPPAYRR